MWIALVIIALVIFVLVSGDRGKPMSASKPEVENLAAGSIDRSQLVPPGMRARQ